MDGNDPWAAFKPQPAPSGPVYGAPPPPAQAYQGPQAAANLQRTQQEIKQAEATASATTIKTDAEAQSAKLKAQTDQEAFDAAHPKGIGSTVVGQDFKKTLPLPIQELDQALIDGRLAFPAGFALKAPWWQERLQEVAQIDPTFDATNFNNRAKARASIVSGKLGTSGNALNTAIGHIDILSSQLGGTASHGPWSVAGIPIPGATTVNALENSVLRSSGQSGITNFQDTASKLADELESVYRNGGGAEQGVVRQLRNLDPNMSGEQKHGIIRNALELLSSKQAANLYQYNIGSGGKPPVDLLDPAAHAVLDKYPDIRDKYFARPAPALSGQAAALLQHNGGTPPPGAPGIGGGTTPPAPNLPPDQHTPATGGTKEVYDPSMTPVRQEYMARLQAGQSGTQLVGFLRKAGLTDTALLKSAADQAAFRRQHPDIPIAAYNTAAIDHHVQQMGVVNRAVNAIGQTGVGAAAIAGGNAVLGGFGPDLVGAVGGNEEQARLAGQYSAQDHPGAALAGSIAGGTAAALAGEGALGAGGMGAGFGRSLLADSAYGAVAGAGGNPDSRTTGAIEGGLAGAAGSVVGQGLAKGASAVLRGVTNADVGTLAANEVNSLTPGQIVANSGRAGQLVKGVEDRLSGFAGPGTMINARRAEGYRQFNAAAFDQALKPIAGSVKGAVGEDAMSAASDQVSQAFSTALKGKSAVPDAEFINQARGPLERLAANKRVGPEIVDSIEQATQGLFDEKTGALAGENMQAFLQALRQIKQGYKSDPLYQTTIKPSIQGLENAVEGMFQRQAPEVMPAFNAAKAAYRRVSILADAVDKGKQTEGVFTPGQLGMADRANAKKLDGKISSASGQSPFFDLQRAGQNVLPSKVPDSGTAGRLALVGGATGLTGLGAGAGYLSGDAKGGAETGLGLTALLAAAYTRAGNRRLAQLLLSRSPAARALAEKIAGRAPIAGAAATTLALPSPSNP